METYDLVDMILFGVVLITAALAIKMGRIAWRALLLAAAQRSQNVPRERV